MCIIMEELIKNMEKEIALNLLKQGKISKEDIAECVGLLLEEVNELEQKMEVAFFYNPRYNADATVGYRSLTGENVL